VRPRAGKGAPSAGVPEAGPVRTCLACRRTSPQARLLRFVRTAEGLVEPDPRRRRGGRGAYLCRSERCLGEALRRGRWAHAFRGPAALRPETVEQVRALIAAEAERQVGVPGEGGW
jgi:hypothetical protein